MAMSFQTKEKGGRSLGLQGESPRRLRDEKEQIFGKQMLARSHPVGHGGAVYQEIANFFRSAPFSSYAKVTAPCLQEAFLI